MKKNKEHKSKTVSIPAKKPKKYFLSGRRLLCTYLAILAIIFVCVYSFVYDKKVFLGGDNAVYFITGVSIAEGNGYSNAYLPNSPPANHFPVGYPAIISVIVKLFGTSLQVVKTANGFFLLGIVVLLFFIVNELTKNKHLAFIASLLTLCIGHVLSYSFIEMSEVPFAFFALLSLLMFIKTFRIGSSIRQPYFWLLTASIIITFYIRSLGIAGLVAALVGLSVNKRWIQAFVLTTCFIVAYLPWMLRTHHLGGNTYAKQVRMVNPYRPELGTITMADYPKRILENLERYISKEIPLALSGDSLAIGDYDLKSDSKYYVYGLMVLFLTIAGIFSLKEFRWYLFTLMSVTFLLLFIWPPIWTGVRFMIPFIPLLIFFSISGVVFLVSRLWSLVSKTNSSYFQYAPFVFVVFLTHDKSKINDLHRAALASYQPNYSDYFQMAQWCNQNLPDTAIICTRKPELFYLFAMRKCTSYPLTNDGVEMFNFFKKEKIGYVTKDYLGYSSAGLYLIPFVNANVEKLLEIEHVNDYAGVFQIFYDDKFGYFGERKNGLREGKGISKYCDGSMYEGEFHNDNRDGYGKLTSHGMVYIGEWQDGKFHGKGIYYYPSGDYFKGEWTAGKRNCFGRLYRADGRYITGQWVNNVVSGPAYVYDKNDKLIAKGEWHNERFIPSPN